MFNAAQVLLFESAQFGFGRMPGLGRIPREQHQVRFHQAVFSRDLSQLERQRRLMIARLAREPDQPVVGSQDQAREIQVSEQTG